MSKNSFASIDASTNSMAFAYFKDGELKNWGKIKYYGSDIHEKINDTAHKTLSFFQNFEVDKIVIEQAIYANSPKTAQNLAMSQGALLAAAAIGGVSKVASVSPMVWQNYIGNKRLTTEEKYAIRSKTPNKSASWYKTQERLFRKQRTIKFVNDKFGISVDDDDIADAIAIGSWTIDNYGRVF